MKTDVILTISIIIFIISVSGLHVTFQFGRAKMAISDVGILAIFPHGPCDMDYD